MHLIGSLSQVMSTRGAVQGAVQEGYPQHSTDITIGSFSVISCLADNSLTRPATL